MDEVIFEEFKGTGNMELRLDRKLADKRVYPAIDIEASGTRKEELLFSTSELAQVWKLRRVLMALPEPAAGLELLIDRLKNAKSNAEFLADVAKNDRERLSEETTLKTDIHPEYGETTVTCSCGNTFTTALDRRRVTLHVELCNECHPFYTGKQKLVDSGGRVERFQRRYGARRRSPAPKRPRRPPRLLRSPR